MAADPRESINQNPPATSQTQALIQRLREELYQSVYYVLSKEQVVDFEARLDRLLALALAASPVPSAEATGQRLRDYSLGIDAGWTAATTEPHASERAGDQQRLFHLEAALAESEQAKARLERELVVWKDCHGVTADRLAESEQGKQTVQQWADKWREEAKQLHIVLAESEQKQAALEKAVTQMARENRRIEQALSPLRAQVATLLADKEQLEQRYASSTWEGMVAALAESEQAREQLQASLDLLHGRKFSERVYVAMLSRAEAAEKSLAESEHARQQLKALVSVLRDSAGFSKSHVERLRAALSADASPGAETQDQGGVARRYRHERLAMTNATNDAPLSDWTLDAESGRANSSPLYLDVVSEVAGMIRNLRVGDDPETAARWIVSGLAHGPHKFAPTGADTP